MAVDFSTMSRRGQWGVILFVCVAMTVAFYMYVWQGNAEDFTRVRAQIATARMEINRTEIIAARLPELQAELARLESRLDTLSIILPPAAETDELLRRVEAAASDSNLDVLRTSFEDPIPHDFFAEKPFSLDVRGTYHNLARFFDRVGKFARIINIDQVNISALDEVGSDSIQASCTAKTFFFLEKEAAAAAEAEASQETGTTGR
jgi:type IV pilus assembly protein PilO